MSYPKGLFATRCHEEIKRWVTKRGGHPAQLKGTGSVSKPGVLRVDLPAASDPDEKLEPISWPEFFQKFDHNHLGFLYQERTSKGYLSHFFKFRSYR